MHGLLKQPGCRLYPPNSPEAGALLAEQGLGPADLDRALANLERVEATRVGTIVGINEDGLFGVTRAGWRPDLPDALQEPFIPLLWLKVHELLGRVPEGSTARFIGANVGVAARNRMDEEFSLKNVALLKPDQLDLKRTREIPSNHWLIGALEAGDVLDLAQEVPDVVRSLPERSRIVVTDERTGTELAPVDIGVGFSQVVPIIAAAMVGRFIVAIEQPELHLHPGQQVALGDVFLHTAFEAGDDLWGPASRDRTLAEAWAKTFLIEIHSEHLILRFLRRIRQTFGGDPADPEA